jgi:hypothetical protein
VDCERRTMPFAKIALNSSLHSSHAGCLPARASQFPPREAVRLGSGSGPAGLQHTNEGSSTLRNLKLELFTPSKIPRYATLAHTWSDEISFQEFNDLEKAKTKRGFSKIEMICKLARENNV